MKSPQNRCGETKCLRFTTSQILGPDRLKIVQVNSKNTIRLRHWEPSKLLLTLRTREGKLV